MRALRAALAFSTRLPVGRLDTADFAQAPAWFAVAGLAIGAVQAVVFWAAALLWPATIAALLAVVAGIVLTGALHEDGLADTVDGLGSGRPPERALEIMRDSRIGSFGALGLGLVVGLRVLALAALPLAPIALIAGQTLSRAAMTVVFRRGRYLRAVGAGSGMEAPLAPFGIVAALIACGLASALLGAPLMILAALTGAALGAGVIWAWAQRRLGGITGDICGAAQQLAEVGVYLGILACL